MKSSLLRTSLVCIFLFAVTEKSFAQAEKEAARDVKAIKPEVQTAAWAVEWWGPRHEEKLKRIQEGDVGLLMIGDSITHGWETTGKIIWDEFYSERNTANLGFSGDRTEHVIWRLQNGEVDDISPKLAVLMIGTNNTGLRQDPAEDTAMGIQHIIKELVSRVPDIKVLLLAIFPRGSNADDPGRVRNKEINAIISKYADSKSVFYLNLNEKFLAADGTLPKSVMPDLLHPNVEGYRIWAEAMEPMIRRLLGE